MFLHGQFAIFYVHLHVTLHDVVELTMLPKGMDLVLLNKGSYILLNLCATITKKTMNLKESFLYIEQYSLKINEGVHSKYCDDQSNIQV